MSAAAAMGATPAAMPPPAKRRRAYFVQLSTTSCCEVSLKELIAQQGGGSVSPSRANGATGSGGELEASAGTSANAGQVPTSSENGGPGPLVAPRTQRFDIIERLEKRYGGGAIVGPAVLHGGINDASGEDRGEASYKRGDDDDLYDSEDSFIDDAELQQNIEEIHTQSRVQTKHSGFFVNAGDEIETIHNDDALSGDRSSNGDAFGTAGNAPKKAAKRPKKGGAESSRAVKAFIDEWADAASDWQPGPDVLNALDALRTTVQEMTETKPFTKVFPRQLDDALRAVDRLAVEAHPNKWRVNGYFATLMTFLPFTKQYLKSNMLRLEARDSARTAKDRLDEAMTSLATEIDVYGLRLQTEAIDTVKEAIVQDTALANTVHQLLGILDDWVVKENDYRQMLKTEDKKKLKPQEFVQLNTRQERNRLFNRMHTLFPPGSMDLQSLRAMNRAAKTKASRKTAVIQSKPVVAIPKKTKSPVSAAASFSDPPKRAIKPFKSRLIDDAPVFAEQDFDETVT